MKSISGNCLMTGFLFLFLSQTVRSQTLCFLELAPDDNSRMIFQIQPDLNYTNVVAFVSFFSSSNTLLRQGQAFLVTDNLNKYVIRDSCTTRIFPIHVKNVDHVKLLNVSRDVVTLKADGMSADVQENGSVINMNNVSTPIAGINLAPANNGSFVSINDGTFTDGPSIAGTAAGNFYFFARKNDGLIYYSVGLLGGANSAWTKVDGQVSAASAPASCAVGSQIFVAVRASNNEIYLNQAGVGHPFNNYWQSMNFQTDAAPSMVASGNYLYIFAKNPAGAIYFNRAALGKSFEGWKPVSGNATAAAGSSPSAGAIGDYIYILIRGVNNNVYLNQGSAGSSFMQWQPMNFLTYGSPSAVGVGQYIYFFAQSTAGKVEYNYAKIGGGGVGWKPVNGNVVPAQSVFAGSVSNNYLFVAIKGSDSRFYLNQGGATGPFNEWWNLLR